MHDVTMTQNTWPRNRYTGVVRGLYTGVDGGLYTGVGGGAYTGVGGVSTQVSVEVHIPA